MRLIGELPHVQVAFAVSLAFSRYPVTPGWGGACMHAQAHFAAAVPAQLLLAAVYVLRLCHVPPPPTTTTTSTTRTP